MDIFKWTIPLKRDKPQNGKECSGLGPVRGNLDHGISMRGNVMYKD